MMRHHRQEEREVLTSLAVRKINLINTRVKEASLRMMIARKVLKNKTGPDISAVVTLASLENTAKQKSTAVTLTHVIMAASVSTYLEVTTDVTALNTTPDVTANHALTIVPQNRVKAGHVSQSWVDTFVTVTKDSLGSIASPR